MTRCPDIINGTIVVCEHCIATRATGTGSKSRHCIGNPPPRYPYGSNEHGPSLVSIFGTPPTEALK